MSSFFEESSDRRTQLNSSHIVLPCQFSAPLTMGLDAISAESLVYDLVVMDEDESTAVGRDAKIGTSS